MSTPVQLEETPGEDGNTCPGPDAEAELEWLFPASDGPPRHDSSPFDFDDWLKLDFDDSDSDSEPPPPKHPYHVCERCRNGHRLHTHTFGYATLKRDKPILFDTRFRYPTLRQMANANISDDFQRLDSAIEALVASLENQFSPQRPRNSGFRWQPNETHANDRIHLAQEMLNQCSLVYGAPENSALWNNHRPLILQGAIWSILLNTILQNKFAVFGNRAQHLAQEWVSKDYDVASATWRKITTEQLLIRCGIAQCEFTSEEVSGKSLRALLHNAQTLEHTTRELTNELIRRRNRRWSTENSQGARDDVAVIFQDADLVARQSIHEARVQFVESMQTWAGSTFTTRIAEVATHAQILALHMAVSSRSYDLIVPTLGQRIDYFQHRPASCCTLNRAGRVIFVVHPGIEGRDDPGDDNTSFIRRAQVYHDGSLDDGIIPESSAPPPEQPSVTGSMKIGHMSASLIPDNLPEIELPVLPQFIELRSDIISFTKVLDTYPELDQQRELRHFTISDGNAEIPWEQTVKKHFYRESVIWNVLIEPLNTHKFGIFGNYNDRYSLSSIIYSGTDGDRRLLHERNEWRWFSARQLFNRLGGTAVLAPPHRFGDAHGNDLHQHIERRKEEIYDLIATRLLGGIPQQPLERLQLIVQKAALLSIIMLVQKNQFIIFRPEINAMYQTRNTKVIELTDDHPPNQEGRVTFVVCPGLYELSDPPEENLITRKSTDHAASLVRLERQRTSVTQNSTNAVIPTRRQPPSSVERLLPLRTGPPRFTMPPKNNDSVRPGDPSTEGGGQIMSGGRTGLDML